MVLPKIESRALKYGYANARVKGMKGLLIDQPTLEELVKVRTVDGMIELLQRTHYKGHFVKGSVSYSGSALVELAAGRSFLHSVEKLKSFTPKDSRPAIQALLRKWGLVNLKTLIHAKRLGKTYEEVKPYLFPVGGITEADFERIMRANDREIFREVRHTELGAEMLASSTMLFSKQMRDTFNNALKSMNMFMQMETIMDAYIYLLMDKALSEVGGTEIQSIRKIMKLEIDAKNILIVERMKKHGYEAGKIRSALIRGGTLRESFVAKLLEAKDTGATVALIRSKFRRLQLKEGDTSLVGLEIALEKALAAEKVSSFHRSILSLGVILGFLLLKEEEMNNLRKIAKAKEFNLPEAEVKEMLVII
ncbi:MAG: V-type ATPase subunit [Candidatus Micrarchaeota archaeon]